MSFFELLELPGSAISRLLGIAELKPATRSHLRKDQAKAMLEMVPALSAGALVVLAAWVFTMTARGHAPGLMGWAGVLATAHFALAFVAWRAFADGQPSQRAVTTLLVATFSIGAMWGIGLGASVSDIAFDVRFATLAAGVGIGCLSIIVFATFPAAGAMFLIPLLSGLALGASRLPSGDMWGPLLITAGVAMYVPVVALSPMRVFIGLFSSQRRLHEQQEIIRLLLKEFGNNPSDWIWHFDRDGHIANVSDRFAAAAGTDVNSLSGQEFSGFLRHLSADNDALVLEVDAAISERGVFHDVVVKVDHDGEERWWCLTGKPSYDETNTYCGYIGTASDITAERLAERKINFLAHHDALTGLLNRGKFTEHLTQVVARLERYGSPFTVLYLDLDKFKFVNDSRGHLIGDQLLAQVSKRIMSCLSDTDFAARLGGDEFAIIMSSNCEASDASAIAALLLDEISKPYHLNDETLTIGVSIGIAMAPVNGTRPDQILRNADLALYRAKAEGRSTFRFFETQMDSSMRERRMLELELREAIENNEFVLHYQPLVSAVDHRPTGAEALMRWDHPIRGIVPPAEFIPIAEQSGLIQQIGDWTIREACRAAAQWPNDFVVAVNVSAKHFQLSDIVAVVRDALEDSKLAPNRLELEITESLLIQRPDEVVAKLTEIKSMGVTIAMDDFGTGYSSLSYLLKFPFDKIKIDKSFVTASSEDRVARDILRTISSLGRSLKIRITAEGVETDEQVEFLRDIACNQLQGYYFSRPLDTVDLAAYFLRGFATDVRSSADIISFKAVG